MKKKRYILIRNGEEIGQFNYMTEVAKLLGCRRQYIYYKLANSTDGKTFKLKNNNITINDLLK